MNVTIEDAARWPQPLSDPDSAGFWAATAAGELAIARCVACGLWMQPPLERCRACGGEVGFEQVSGAGTLYSWIAVNRQSVPGPKTPYLIGVVELAEQPGIRLSGVLDTDDAPALRAGLPATVGLQPVPGGDFVAPVIRV